MSDKPVELVANAIPFYSARDEQAFFEWLKKLPAIVSVRGEDRAVVLGVAREQLDDDQLRELIALFFRYGVDMKQLRTFETSSNRSWLTKPSSYWFARLYA